MTICNSKQSIFFTLTLLITIGHSAIAPSRFCWRDYYRRQPVAKGQCQAGKHLYGLMCYDQCPAHMPMTQFDCIYPFCPNGLTNQLTTCTQIYYRMQYWPVRFAMDQDERARMNCEADYGYGNCVKWILNWLPKCKDGYLNWDSNSCKNFHIDCQAYGFKNTPSTGPFFMKDRLFLVPSQPVCPAGTENHDFSCYALCKQGYQGVGPYCWKESSKRMMNCGVGLSLDQESCTSSVLPFSNLTLFFNIAAQNIFYLYEFLLIKDDKAALEQGTLKLKKNLQDTYKLLHSNFISKQHNDLLPFLRAKLQLPQYTDSVRAIFYILQAVTDIPMVQLLQFMAQFVSLFTEQEINKMRYPSQFTSCLNN